MRPAVGDHVAGIGIKQTVDFDFERNPCDKAGADDLLLSRHEHGIELIRLKAGDDLSGLDILRLERAVAFEDLRMLRLIERQLTGEPSIDVSADQKRLRRRRCVLSAKLSQRGRFAFLKGFELCGAHIGHVHFRRIIILRRNRRKVHYCTSSVSVAASSDGTGCSSCDAAAAVAASLRFCAHSAQSGTP